MSGASESWRMDGKMASVVFSWIGLLTLVALIALVVIRVRMLGARGIAAFKFGQMDRRELLILPLVLLLVYLVTAATVFLPHIGRMTGRNTVTGAVGAAMCACSVALFAWALWSFGKSFRVGIDEDNPGSLVTTGAFALTRNPIYVAFVLALIGFFLIYWNWVLLLFIVGATMLFNRQVRLEEASLRKLYGDAYRTYCRRVRRF